MKGKNSKTKTIIRIIIVITPIVAMLSLNNNDHHSALQSVYAISPCSLSQQPFKKGMQPSPSTTHQATNNINSIYTATSAAANYDDFQDGIYNLTNGQTSPNGKWQASYTGHGSMGVATTTTNTSGARNNYFFEQPKISTSRFETHASLAITTANFENFQMTVQMKTVKQLRQNSPPNTWETAWILWHMTDNFHYYALVLKPNGFQLEKKDNNNRNDAGEIYLVTNHEPKVKVGQWQTVTIRHENSSSCTPHIQVWVDGIKAADFIDNFSQRNSPQMASGAMGLYNEDSKVNFDNVSINSIP